MKVALLGNGLSRDDFVSEMMTESGKYDEVWGVNTIGNIIRCDKIFMLDDVEYLLTMPRFEWIKDCKTPIYTSKTNKAVSEYLIEYPFDAICEKYGTRYFSNTVAYAIAYALHVGVKELAIFGCDYDYNGEVHEINRAGTEFWLGIAYALGVKISISNKSSLMNMNGVQSYAYDTKDAEGE